MSKGIINTSWINFKSFALKDVSDEQLVAEKKIYFCAYAAATKYHTSKGLTLAAIESIHNEFVTYIDKEVLS